MIGQKVEGPEGRPWTSTEIAELERLSGEGAGVRMIAKLFSRTQKSVRQKAMELNVSLASSGNRYVFGYYLFTSRQGRPPNLWAWEIRRKSKPNEQFLSEKGFRSAKAAEEAASAILEDLREKARAQLSEKEFAAECNATPPKAARPPRLPLTPEQRSENARKAALARAAALTPEQRSKIARLGGAASKEKAKLNRIIAK